MKKVLLQLSAFEKISQLFFLPISILVPTFTTIKNNPSSKQLMPQWFAGGYVVFKDDLENETVRSIISYFSSASFSIKPLIGIDEEGGYVSRLSTHLNYKLPSAYSLKDASENTIRKTYYDIGNLLRQNYISLDFAPVADLHVPENNIIGKYERAFHEKADIAGNHVVSAIEGLHQAGIASTIKHWPGHGFALQDSHLEQSISYRSYKDMIDTDMLVFKKGIVAGADMVMTGHITVPSVDALPASISKKWLHILRDEYMFKGVIITDSMKMKAITSTDVENLPLVALTAGNDMILIPQDFEKAFCSVKNAIAYGVISEEEIDQKLERILLLKQRYKLL